jgi:hypothetical protein
VPVSQPVAAGVDGVITAMSFGLLGRIHGIVQGSEVTLDPRRGGDARRADRRQDDVHLPGHPVTVLTPVRGRGLLDRVFTGDRACLPRSSGDSDVERSLHLARRLRHGC